MAPFAMQVDDAQRGLLQGRRSLAGALGNACHAQADVPASWALSYSTFRSGGCAIFIHAVACNPPPMRSWIPRSMWRNVFRVVEGGLVAADGTVMEKKSGWSEWGISARGRCRPSVCHIAATGRRRRQAAKRRRSGRLGFPSFAPSRAASTNSACWTIELLGVFQHAFGFLGGSLKIEPKLEPSLAGSRCRHKSGARQAGDCVKQPTAALGHELNVIMYTPSI